MNNKLNRIVVLIAFSLICFMDHSKAQTYKVGESKENNMKLSGTSTLHDWKMIAKTFTGDAQFDFSTRTDTQIVMLQSLTFSLVVVNLKSDKKALEKNAYKALKSNQYKNILYTLKSSKVTSVKENRYLLRALGYLTIAGVTREIVMDVTCLNNKDGTVTCTGSYVLNMTDYQVKPPSFMLGAMKTGQAITLDFTMVYKKQIGI